MGVSGLKGLLTLTCFLSACVALPRDFHNPPPASRPEPVLNYYRYDQNKSFQSITEQIVTRKDEYVHKRILIDTPQGQTTIEYYQRHEQDDRLIFVFPVLGGQLSIEGYFASYFAKHGFDTAIVHRDQDFKRPERFGDLEEIFRKSVIRDRIAIDFFEQNYAKKQFGSFGISRGAMNAAITAGVDSRLKYNVLALGGSHLVEVFKKSDVHGIKKYRDQVLETNGITEEQFYEALEESIITEPKNYARFLNPKNTLMFLSIFDKAVPFKYGLKLREEAGTPQTIFLFAGHYTALLFTQFVKLLPPWEEFCIFPFDFVESQSLDFYNNSFDTGRIDIWHFPFKLVQLPGKLFGYLYYAFF